MPLMKMYRGLKDIWTVGEIHRFVRVLLGAHDVRLLDDGISYQLDAAGPRYRMSNGQLEHVLACFTANKEREAREKLKDFPYLK